MSAYDPPPKISIIIPAYNASASITECLNHVYASEFKDFEAIVINDGSTDSTSTTISSYPCRVVASKVNRGASVARNQGLKEARGDIVLFVDSDVLIPRDLLGKIRDFFELHPEVSALQARYSDAPYYRNILSQYKHYVFSFRGLNPGHPYINYVHTACVAFQREALKDFLFDEHLRRREDIEFGLRLSKSGRLIYADTSLAVGHKKKYDFLSFTKYQFQAHREGVLEYLTAKGVRFYEEYTAARHALYKKLWLLRPVLSFLLLLDLIWLAIWGSFVATALLISIFVASFFLEFKFRLYLFQVASIQVSVGAAFIYFYDGFLMNLGIIASVFQATVFKWQFLPRKEPNAYH